MVKVLNSMMKGPMDAAKAASTDVIVVPMFDPKVKGYILSTLINPSPTSGVRVEVNTDEL
jgi:hypothetical protein